jgi:SAM-dependent methyltransferase
MATFDSEKAFQDDYYRNLKITRNAAFGIGKEWRLAIPQYLCDNGFKLEGSTVADIGCGTGYFGASLLRNHNVDHVDFYDVAPSLSTKIKETFEITKSTPSYQYICADIIDANLRGDQYDYVFCMGSLHHAYNLVRNFESIYKMLKPGGFLVAQEPSYSEVASYSDLRSTYEERLGFKASASQTQNYPRHDFFFRLSEFCCMGRLAGFEVSSITPWGREMGRVYENDQIQAKQRIHGKIIALKIKAKEFLARKKVSIKTSSQDGKKICSPEENLLIFSKPLSSEVWLPHLDLLGCKI